MKITAEDTVVIMDLCDYMEEQHTEEIETNHHGDGRKGCTYCDATKAGRKLLLKMVRALAKEEAAVRHG